MAENPSNHDRDDDQPQDPLSQMFSQMFGGQIPGMPGGDDGQAPSQPDMQAMFGRLQSLFGAMAQGQQGDDAVNWRLVKDSSAQAVQDSRAVTPESRQAVESAARLADLWLDAATEFPATPQSPRVMTRAQWAERTLPQWQSLTEPVARSASETVSRSIDSALQEQMPPEAAGMFAQAGGFLKSLGGALFGAQLGQAVGTLATEVLSGTDAGFPLAGAGFALVPQNIANFGEGLEQPDQEIMLYVALREAAHQRLFHAAPWLQEHILELVRDFASGITFDMDGMQEQLRGVDPTDMDSLQEIMGSGMLEPTKSPAQKAALARLETTLALVEGWVEVVVTEAAANLPAAPALRETIRRRRALGGPSEQAFAGLVGLELRPRRARDAATLWEAITEERGVTARDELWLDPGLVPTAEDLDDPEGFAARRALLDSSDEDFDAAVAAWLSPEEVADAGSGKSQDEGSAQDEDSAEGDEQTDGGEDPR